jgi:hypothetical protein
MGRLSKIFVVTSASLLLLYYGVAWAVLRCCHDDTYSRYEVARYITSNPYNVHTNIECSNTVNRTESIAESSSPSRLDRLTPNTTPHVNDFLNLLGAKNQRAGDLYLRAVFETPLLIDSPRYLSLSILRI